MFESKISKELHRRVFELTLAIYRVTDFFPPGEVLRRNLREKANEIFGNVSEYGYSENMEQAANTILAKVEAIKGYLEIARSMRFVRPINITILEREYDRLCEFFAKEPTASDIKTSEPQAAPSKEELPTWNEFSKVNGTTERQKAILEHVKQAKQAKISDFYSSFNGVSSKTIQRDLQDLVAKSILKKEGTKRWTVYSLNGVQ